MPSEPVSAACHTLAQFVNGLRTRLKSPFLAPFDGVRNTPYESEHQRPSHLRTVSGTISLCQVEPTSQISDSNMPALCHNISYLAF
jgi:hypothetical protein